MHLHLLRGAPSAAVAEDVDAFVAVRATRKLIFSTIPRIGTFTWWNMWMALRASSSETSEGVVTTIAPVMGAVWMSESCTSPVPGGRSITR
jgi:hypothetical protein